MNKHILILQTRIPHYRIAFFNKLCEHYDVTVLHSGKPVGTSGAQFRELIVPQKKLGPFYWQSRVYSTVNSGEYDAVIAMFAVQWLSTVRCILFPGKVPFLLWGHRFTRSPIANWIRAKLLKKADGVLLYGTDELENVLAVGVPSSSVFIAPNSMHIENSLDCSTLKKDSFLFVGRAQPRKKVDMLISSFARVLNDIPSNIVLDIVGDGPENTNLKKLVDDLALNERVCFHGEINDDAQLRTFFERALAYVSPGAVGLGVLHSFAYGVPVVTRREEYHGPEYVNLVDGKNAQTFDTNKELDDILRTFSNDPSKAAELGKNAHIFYRTERTIDGMVDGFRKAIEGP